MCKSVLPVLQLKARRGREHYCETDSRTAHTCCSAVQLGSAGIPSACRPTLLEMRRHGNSGGASSSKRQTAGLASLVCCLPPVYELMVSSPAVVSLADTILEKFKRGALPAGQLPHLSARPLPQVSQTLGLLPFPNTAVAAGLSVETTMRKLLAALLSPLLITLMCAPLLVLLAAPFDADMEAGPFQGAAAGVEGGGSGAGAPARRLLQESPAPNDTSTLTNFTGDCKLGMGRNS